LLGKKKEESCQELELYIETIVTLNVVPAMFNEHGETTLIL
jgi:hypothetical protein